MGHRRFDTRMPVRVRRLGLWRRARLGRAARIDAAHGIPRVERDLDRGTVAAHTPTTRAIADHAVQEAEAIGDAFRAEIAPAWVERGALLRSVPLHQALLDRLPGPDDQDDPGGAERARRGQDRLDAAGMRLAALDALINDRFTRAQLAASIPCRYADEQIACYWKTLRRRHTDAAGLADTPPAIERPIWLADGGGRNALEAWAQSPSSRDHPAAATGLPRQA